MADAAVRAGWARFANLAQHLIEGWALLGGILLVLIALMNTWSVLSLALLGHPVPGDFEMVEMGVAIAAFSFLPYCQLKGANVTADIFTMKASRFWIDIFTLLAALVAMFFSIILLWRMSDGMLSYMKYVEVTTILNIPIWIAFPPILVSLALMVLAGILTVHESIADIRAPNPE